VPRLAAPPLPRVYAQFSLYIGRHFLMALVGSLLVIMGLIFLLDFIELMRRAAGRPDASAAALAIMALLKLPNMIHQVLPFSVLIGGMIAVWRLTRSQELVIMRAVGVSIWQVLAPALVVVAVIGVVDVVAINPLSAALYKSYERMEDDLILSRSGTFDISQGGLWLREARPAGSGKEASDGAATGPATGTEGDGGQVVVRAGHVRQDGLVLRMRDLSFFFLGPSERFVRRVDAATGTLTQGRFHLTDVWDMRPGEPGVRHDRMDLATSLTLGRVQENFASPETLSFWELPAFIDFFESAGFSAQQHRMYWHSLIASPFLLCAMVLMAAVFSVSPNTRSGRGVLRVVGGIGTGFVVYFVSKLTYALGLSDTLPLWLAAWSPTLTTTLLGTATLLHMEDG
jgi:lipopolysaccharide export system permease protein